MLAPPSIIKEVTPDLANLIKIASGSSLLFFSSIAIYSQ